MCNRLKNLTITIIWINFGLILIGYNYLCFFRLNRLAIDRISITSLFYMAAMFFFNYKLCYQKFSDLSKYVKVFENLYSMILISINLFHCNRMKKKTSYDRFFLIIFHNRLRLFYQQNKTQSIK